jgi:hypothetical protein
VNGGHTVGVQALGRAPGHDPARREACRRTRDVPLHGAVGFLPMRRRPCPSHTHGPGEER